MLEIIKFRMKLFLMSIWSPITPFLIVSVATAESPAMSSPSIIWLFSSTFGKEGVRFIPIFAPMKCEKISVFSKNKIVLDAIIISVEFRKFRVLKKPALIKNPTAGSVF